MNEKSFLCLVQVLDKCKRWGYTEVWFNHENSHWGGYTGSRQRNSGVIVAAPRRGGSPALWGLGYDPLEREVLGRMGCGNRLTFADQAQYDFVDKNFPRSYYRFNNGQWRTEEEIYGGEQ